MDSYKKKQHFADVNGLTLVELLVATMVFSLAFLGLLLTFVKSMELHETSRNSTYALNAVKSRVEQIKNTDFHQIYNNYHRISFTDAAVSGVGISYVDNSDPDLLKIWVSFSWRQKNSRVVGEDQDLDGILDAGEDLDSNGMLSSPVQVSTYIFNTG